MRNAGRMDVVGISQDNLDVAVGPDHQQPVRGYTGNPRATIGIESDAIR
jgi:hypothetical protein